MEAILYIYISVCTQVVLTKLYVKPHILSFNENQSEKFI